MLMYHQIKTLELIRTNFFWPNITVDVKDYIAKYEIWHQNKSPNTSLRSPMSSQYEVQRPHQKLYNDLLGSYLRSKVENIGIIIVLDHLTKFPLFKANK